MKLSDYMALQKIDDAAMAAILYCDRSTVTRLRNGTTVPNWKNLALIKEATKGAVTFDDFTPRIRASKPRKRTGPRLVQAAAE